MTRPRVGISRCLLGDAVRYDGTHRLAGVVIAALDSHVDWVPVCPEVEVGMGTPREPIQLVARADGVRSGSSRVRLLGVETGSDWTARMHAWARDRVETLRALDLSGFILKARSPSCGIRDVAIHDRRPDRSVRLQPDPGRGLFAQALIDAMPDLPVADEDDLRTAEARDAFLTRVRSQFLQRSR
jgi:uncharacterized protein YbbK (DUF523 family)